MNSFDDTNIELENARAIFGVDGSKIDSIPMTTEIYSEQQTDTIISSLSSKIEDTISTAILPKNIVLPNYFGENNNYNLDSWIDAVDDAVGNINTTDSILIQEIEALKNEINTIKRGKHIIETYSSGSSIDLSLTSNRPLINLNGNINLICSENGFYTGEFIIKTSGHGQINMTSFDNVEWVNACPDFSIENKTYWFAYVIDYTSSKCNLYLNCYYEPII